MLTLPQRLFGFALQMSPREHFLSFYFQFFFIVSYDDNVDEADGTNAAAVLRQRHLKYHQIALDPRDSINARR